MYLLDTNILSEVRRRTPIAVKWMETVERRSTCVSVISLGEIKKGIEILASRDAVSARRLQSWLEAVSDDYADSILPISREVALAWGRIAAGRTRGTPDALIAATAIVHGLTLVTRNVKDFADLPLALVDPWTA